MLLEVAWGFGNMCNGVHSILLMWYDTVMPMLITNIFRRLRRKEKILSGCNLHILFLWSIRNTLWLWFVLFTSCWLLISLHFRIEKHALLSQTTVTPKKKDLFLKNKKWTPLLLLLKYDFSIRNELLHQTTKARRQYCSPSKILISLQWAIILMSFSYF